MDIPLSDASGQVYTDYRSPRWTADHDMWEYVEDCYSMRCARADRVKNYIPKRFNGETTAAYEERIGTVDFKAFFPHLIDAIAGMVTGTQDADNLVWGDGYGDPKDTHSYAAQILRDADGRGTGWHALWKEAASRVTALKLVYGMVSTIGVGNEERGVLQIISPSAVVRCVNSQGRLVAVVIREEHELDEDVESRPQSEEQFLILSLDGFRRVRVVVNAGVRSVAPVVGDGNEGTHSFVDRAGAPILPIFPIELPIARDVGYQQARSFISIINLSSMIDAVYRAASFPLLNLAVDDDHYTSAVEALQKGGKILQSPPDASGRNEFIAAPADHAAAMQTLFETKVQHFYMTGFKEYGDSARQKTATEVNQDVSSGMGAFLQLLTSALEDGQNRALDLLIQTQYSSAGTDYSRFYFKAYIERSRDFGPINIGNTVELIMSSVFGKDSIIPMGIDAQIDGARQIADLLGLPFNEEQARAAIVLENMYRTKELMVSMTGSTTLNNELVENYALAIGLDLEKTVYVDSPGSNRKKKRKLIDVIRDELEETAALPATAPTPGATPPGTASETTQEDPAAGGIPPESETALPVAKPVKTAKKKINR